MNSPPPNQRLDAIDLRVASRLRQRRRELQVDPRMLDIVIGEPAGTVARLEAGERRISAAHLFRLGQALNVDVPYFFAEDAGEGGGASEGGADLQDPPSPAMPLFTEGDQLTRMFRRLPSHNLRRLVLRLIRSIAAREQKEKEK
jgi:transcriptional regulator with XRE-family HTH domain